MTVKVRWLAPRESYRRVLRPKDFTALGIPVNQEMTFEKGNQFTCSMEDAAGELLASKLPDEFVVLNAPGGVASTEAASEGSEAASSDQSPDESGQAEPDGSSSESQDEETTTASESPSKRSRKS